MTDVCRPQVPEVAHYFCCADGYVLDCGRRSVIGTRRHEGDINTADAVIG